jgi:hypothetical protein
MSPKVLDSWHMIGQIQRYQVKGSHNPAFVRAPRRPICVLASGPTFSELKMCFKPISLTLVTRFLPLSRLLLRDSPLEAWWRRLVGWVVVMMIMIDLPVESHLSCNSEDKTHNTCSSYWMLYNHEKRKRGICIDHLRQTHVSLPTKDP